MNIKKHKAIKQKQKYIKHKKPQMFFDKNPSTCILSGNLNMIFGYAISLGSLFEGWITMNFEWMICKKKIRNIQLQHKIKSIIMALRITDNEMMTNVWRNNQKKNTSGILIDLVLTVNGKIEFKKWSGLNYMFYVFSWVLIATAKQWEFLKGPFSNSILQTKWQ